MYNFLKRTFEIIVPFISLIILSPLFLIVAIAIKIEDRGKIIYVQKRYGKNKKIFNIYKFRSMKETTGAHFTTASDDRITKVGKFVRRTKIDELPQLLNVLKGDMSFVGPRPDIEEHIKHYTEDGDIGFTVKPGITGLVSYVYKIEQEILEAFDDNEKKEKFFIEKMIPEKCRLNKIYAQKVNFKIDVQLFLATFGLLKKVKIDEVEYKPLTIQDIIDVVDEKMGEDK